RQSPGVWGSVEDGTAGAAALDLEEAVGAGDEDAAVEEAAGLLPLRCRGDDGAEEGDVTHGDHRGAHVVADEDDRPRVALPQEVVVLVGVRGPDEIGRQTDLGEGLGAGQTEVL